MPAPDSHEGQYQFPGIFAFFDTPDASKPCLLQHDPQQSLAFDDQTAQNSCTDLEGNFNDGQPGTVTGTIAIRDVNGVTRPVLFYTSAKDDEEE
jgi:hypothetical protein